MAGRHSKRVRATYKVSVGFLGAGASFIGSLVDISTSGLLLHCSQDLKPGSVGRIGIAMGQETLRIVVAVRRRVPSLGIGLEFLQMTSHDRELLHRLLQRLQKSVKS